MYCNINLINDNFNIYNLKINYLIFLSYNNNNNFVYQFIINQSI